MTDVVDALLSVVILLIAFAIRPDHARCPERWHNDGIRPGGRFSCVPSPVGDPDMDGTFGRPDVSIVPPGRLEGRIYCSRPVVVDDRTMGCQHDGSPAP